MRVDSYRAKDQNDLRNFLHRHPNCLFFQSEAYLQLLTQLLKLEAAHLIARNAQGEIQAVLLLLAQNGPWGTVYNSLPFYGSHGGILSVSTEAHKAVCQAYKALALSPDTASITLVSSPFSDADYSEIPYCYLEQRIGQFTVFSQQDDLMSLFHSKTRNMIRKAMSSGLEVLCDSKALDELYQLHKENMQAIGGQAKPETFFQLIPNYFKAQKEYQIYLVKEKNQIISALLLFYFNDIVEYYTPVIRATHRSLQPNSLAIYTAMQDAQKKGYRIWNWGGTWTNQNHIYRFKKRWGTRDQNYYYYCQLNNLNLRKASREDLFNAYPYFFVLPYSELIS